MNVAGRVLHFGKTRPHAPAIVEGARTTTYGGLADSVRRTANYLTSLGLRCGERIGICLKDTSEYVVAILAIALSRGTSVPLDWRARPAENARLIQGLGLRFMLVEPDARAVEGCQSVPLDDEWRRGVAQAQIGGDPAADWQDPFVISATSGSTGLPRFTQLTQQQYHFAISGMLELMDLAGIHRFLCALPLYYSGGRNSCLAHLLRGDCVVLYPSLFSPAEFLSVGHRQKITVAVLVPSMVRQLLAASTGEPIFPSLTKMFSTGAPLHAEEKREALRKLTRNFHERYGTAETLAISVLRPEDFAEKAASVGQPHSLLEVEIADQHDHPLPAGAIGNLRIRGPGLATPLPGHVDDSFRAGWYYPGEIASFDEAGYIFLQGRTSDVIIRSGTKVHPAEIESTLVEHPGVVDVAVLGKRTAGEEEVIAFVVPRGRLSAGALLAHCRARLTPHKVPRQIYFVEELPRNTAGKIDKLALAKTLDPGPE